jgi:trehalose 6-phosphate phosphatase
MTPPVNRNSALFLDIDGTLLDMARTPDDVVVPDGLMASLAGLHDALGGALAFVSGRPLGVIDALFAPLKTAAVGCHGAEVRSADGRVEALAAPIPGPVRALFRALAERHPGTLLEDKTYALSLHYRLAPEARPALLAAVEESAARFADQRVSIQLGKSVIDAKRTGIDKGVGVRALMRQAPFRGRVPLFGGDDTTDMDVFRILPELGGKGFSVGRALKGAAYEFASPEAVRRWLNDLAKDGVTA